MWDKEPAGPETVGSDLESLADFLLFQSELVPAVVDAAPASPPALDQPGAAQPVSYYESIEDHSASSSLPATPPASITSSDDDSGVSSLDSVDDFGDYFLEETLFNMDCELFMRTLDVATTGLF